MVYTDINSEDRLVQATFAEHLEKGLGWEGVGHFYRGLTRSPRRIVSVSKP